MTSQEQLPKQSQAPLGYEAGEVFGGYQLGERLATRDYSVVFKGLNLATQQEVAVKFAHNYDPDTINPIALEVLVHKKVDGEEGVLPIDGFSLDGIDGSAPFIATPFREGGTVKDVLGQDDVQTGSKKIERPELDGTLEQLQSMVDSNDEDIVDPEIFSAVKASPKAINLRLELINEESHLDAGAVLKKVVEIADDQIGKDAIDVTDLTAQKIALDVVQSAEQLPVDNTAEQEVSFDLAQAPHRLAMLHGAAKGIAAIHEKGYILRDIKPSNFLVNDGNQSEVSDFGAAVKDGYVSDTLVTSGGYLAIEERKGFEHTVVDAEAERLVQLDGDSPVKTQKERLVRYNKKGDVFKLSTVLFEAVTGEKPFPMPKDATEEDILAVLASEPAHIDKLYNAPIDATTKIMIRRGLSSHMNVRPTAQQIEQNLAQYV